MLFADKQRYYANTAGLFTTADPYVASLGVASPASWNWYAYVQGDPVNFNDLNGLQRGAVIGESVAEEVQFVGYAFDGEN